MGRYRDDERDYSPFEDDYRGFDVREDDSTRGPLILALAVGAARGLKLGASAEAALIARGFAELSRLALAAGGRAESR